MAKLYFYGGCSADYCGSATSAGDFEEISTGLGSEQLSSVVQIDLNANELVLHFASGEIAVSNPHGLCGLTVWTLTKDVQGFLSRSSLTDGYTGYVLKNGNLRACASGSSGIGGRHCLSAASDGKRVLCVSEGPDSYSIDIFDL